MSIVKESKWQRIRYMIAAPLGEGRKYMTACDEHIQLAREAAREGMVLLKNEDALLPFADGTKLAIFGKACQDYVKGGGGSGNVNPPYITTLLQGLDSKEGRVSYFKPLADYYGSYVQEQYAQGLQPGWVAEPELPEELLKAAREFSDIAVITISRYSKEDYDRTGTPNDGDFYLSVAEETMVKQVLSCFDKVCVILNAGGMMDTLWFKNEPRIQASLLVWQPGMEGGNAIADILMGDECPSGRLTDTFAVDFDAYPSSANFNESDMFVEYQEDIFVGYRYFETVPGAVEKVCYPFGYGLSYTSFSITEGSFTEGNGLTFTAKVKNTGKCAGKQVVQLYCAAPQGKLGKAAKVLVGFAKTKKLAPGESETVDIPVPLSRLASYDDEGRVSKSAWVLEAGEYTFFLGENVRSTDRLSKTYTVASDHILEQLSEKCAPKHLTRRMRADGSYTEYAVEKENRSPFTGDPDIPVHWRMQPPQENNWHQVRTDMKGPFTRRPFIEVYEGKLTLDEFMQDLSTEQLVNLLCGQPNRGPANTFGWGNILEFGVPNAMTCDGPAGLRFQPAIDVKTTNFPCSCQMACTWNRDLMYAVGKATATEVRENGCGIWLAPAVNIHRSPLCGRNFEYLSEDPLVSGLMASALIEGVQSMGIAACLKHFACNNKEFNRKDSSSILSERALREIYLKAFEICVREGDQPWAIMSSYNLINGVHTSASRELLTDILRQQWGYEGVVTTDWFTTEFHYREIAAGNDIKMATGMPAHTLKMIEEGKLSMEDVRTSAKRVLQLILKLA